MDHPRPPPKASLPARSAMDDELQVQAYRPVSDHCPEQKQRLYLRQQLMTRLSFLFQDDRILPTWNVPLVPRPPLGDTISLRRRSKGSRHDHTHTREPTSFQNSNSLFTVNEQNEQSEINGNEGKESSCASNFPNYDIREKKHSIRIEALKKELKPLFPDDGSAVVLLCWGENSGCSILPVPLSSSEDEVSTWEEINRAWYTRRGYWRKYLLGFSVTQVGIVEASMLGLKEPLKERERSEYIGMYIESDILTERRRLQNIIDDCVPTADCSYNRHTGSVDCGFDCECWDCLPGYDDAEECTVKTLRDARRNLSLLDARALMRHVLSNPVLAASNDFLKKENLALSHWDVLSQIDSWHSWHCPGLVELKFRGLVIREGWTLDAQRTPLVVLIFLAVVVAAKFLFGWNTAWTVGGFFVALVMLLWGRS